MNALKEEDLVEKINRLKPFFKLECRKEKPKRWTAELILYTLMTLLETLLREFSESPKRYDYQQEYFDTLFAWGVNLLIWNEKPKGLEKLLQAQEFAENLKEQFYEDPDCEYSWKQIDLFLTLHHLYLDLNEPKKARMYLKRVRRWSQDAEYEFLYEPDLIDPMLKEPEFWADPPSYDEIEFDDLPDDWPF